MRKHHFSLLLGIALNPDIRDGFRHGQQNASRTLRTSGHGAADRGEYRQAAGTVALRQAKF